MVKKTTNIKEPNWVISSFAHNGEKFESYHIRKGIKIIKSYAFHKCINLKEIRIPEGVERIKYGAFQECHRLKKIILPNSLRIIDSWAFSGRQIYGNKLTIVYNGTKSEWAKIRKGEGLFFKNVDWEVQCLDGVIKTKRAAQKTRWTKGMLREMAVTDYHLRNFDIEKGQDAKYRITLQPWDDRVEVNSLEQIASVIKLKRCFA